jgi:hypothetical protein
VRRTWIVVGIVSLALLGFVGCMNSKSPTAPTEIPVPVYPTYEWQGDGVPCGDPMEYTLIAGQNYDAGSISVTLEDGELCIDIETTGGWVLTETHVAVAPDLDSIPQTGSGNPQVGKFLWQTDHDPPVTSATYCCNPLEYIWQPGEIYIAVHASVELLDDSGNVIQQETAWGDGPEFPGRSWATYMTYDVGECFEEAPPVLILPDSVNSLCVFTGILIQYSFFGTPEDGVQIDLYYDDGTYAGPIYPSPDSNDSPVLVGENQYEYPWVFEPIGGPGDLFRIRVTDVATGMYDESDVPFVLEVCGGGGEKR